jgi:hypothetical protein
MHPDQTIQKERQMADSPVSVAPFAPHLEPGEQIRYVAFGVKQPHILLVIGLFALAVLPGAIAVALLTRNYLVALTDRRFIVLRFSGNPRGKVNVKEIADYRLDRMPPVKATTGAIFTHIRIIDPAKPFVAKFHRAAFGGKNRAQAVAIEAVLTGKSVPALAAA